MLLGVSFVLVRERMTEKEEEGIERRGRRGTCNEMDEEGKEREERTRRNELEGKVKAGGRREGRKVDGGADSLAGLLHA